LFLGEERQKKIVNEIVNEIIEGKVGKKILEITKKQCFFILSNFFVV